MSKESSWEKTGTIVAYAEWLREKSGALAVMIVRLEDNALAVDAELAPVDARVLIEERVVELAADLSLARKEKRKAARLEMGEIRE